MSSKKSGDASHSIVYTIAYWIMWKTVESIGDQRLLFGDGMNQPVLVRVGDAKLAVGQDRDAAGGVKLEAVRSVRRESPGVVLPADGEAMLQQDFLDAVSKGGWC